MPSREARAAYPDHPRTAKSKVGGRPPEVTTAEAVLRFAVEREGTYRLWCRVWWLDECGNSLTLVIDKSEPFVFGQDTTYKVWHWVRAPKRLGQLTLSEGEHTLTIRNREDGVLIDQILVTRNPRYVPVGIETVTESP